MARRKNKAKVSMRDIRRQAMVLAIKEYHRVNALLWTANPRDFSLNHVRKLFTFCMDKEYAAGEHQGALNPYC